MYCILVWYVRQHHPSRVTQYRKLALTWHNEVYWDVIRDMWATASSVGEYVSNTMYNTSVVEIKTSIDLMCILYLYTLRLQCFTYRDMYVCTYLMDPHKRKGIHWESLNRVIDWAEFEDLRFSDFRCPLIFVPFHSWFIRDRGNHRVEQ